MSGNSSWPLDRANKENDWQCLFLGAFWEKVFSVFRCFIPQPINYPSINSSRSKSNIFKAPVRIFKCSSTAENGHSLKNSEIFTFFSSFDVEILQQSQCENHCTNLKPHREKFSNPCVTFTHNYCRLCSYKAVYPFMLLPENCNSLVALTTN